MVKVAHTGVIVRLAITGLALGLVVAGCSKSDESSSDKSATSSTSKASSSASSATSSSATSAAPTPESGEPDYASLLMKPEDLPPTPAGPFIGDAPKVDPSDPPDVEQLFHTADNGALITSSILITADPAAAAAALAKVNEKTPELVKGTPTPLPSVASDATLIAGTSPDGTRAVAVLVFTEQNTAVHLLFDSAPNDLNPVPTDFVESVGTTQRDAIAEALPELGS